MPTPTKKRAPRSDAAARALETYARLRAAHPDAHCELDHRSPFELLVATVLSAQTTDVLVNRVTPHLFARYPDAAALAAADVEEVAELLRSQGLGMYRQKAKNLVGLARGLVERHGGEVPRTLAELVALPGVGRKTANVVLGVAWGTPEGVVVDTHVQRLAQRLGWTKETKPEAIERDLCAIFPREEWDMLSHTLIFHGRRVCFARRPACAACAVNALCPSAFHAEHVGRKPGRARAARTTTEAPAKAPPRSLTARATSAKAGGARRAAKSSATAARGSGKGTAANLSNGGGPARPSAKRAAAKRAAEQPATGRARPRARAR